MPPGVSASAAGLCFVPGGLQQPCLRSSPSTYTHKHTHMPPGVPASAAGLCFVPGGLQQPCLQSSPGTLHVFQAPGRATYLLGARA